MGRKALLMLLRLQSTLVKAIRAESLMVRPETSDRAARCF